MFHLKKQRPELAEGSLPKGVFEKHYPPIKLKKASR